MALLQPRALINSAITLNSSELTDAITSLLKTLNPQNPRPESFVSSPLNQFSAYLSSSLVTEVIKKQSNPNHALFFFNWASNLNHNPRNYSHTDSCYAAITNLLLSHSLFAVAFSILDNSQKLNDVFISRFIKVNGARGNIKGAVFWFHKAKAVENGKCLYSYNALLGVLARANKINLAKSFFDQMVRGNVVRPDVSTHTIMIRGYCKLGMVHDARKMFDEMHVRPNLLTFNTIINGYCKKGDMENARSMFNHMTVSNGNFLPDTVTYTTLIDGYCKKGEFQEAMNCMNEMEKAGHEPNLYTYNAIIYGLCLWGKVDEAKKMMSKMRLNGVKDNLATHTSILKGYCFAQRSEEAVEYFRQMVKSNMNPGVKCCEAIANEYCKMKKPDEAISLIREMCRKRMNPSVSSFNSVFRVLLESGEFDEALSVLKHMPKMACSPNFVSYSMLIHSVCSTKGRMSQAGELVHDMLREGFNLDATIYSSLIKGHCEEGNGTKALDFFHEAISKSCVVDIESFLVLVKKLCCERKADEAKKIFEEMCGKCRLVYADSYKRVFEESFFLGCPET